MRAHGRVSPKHMPPSNPPVFGWDSVPPRTGFSLFLSLYVPCVDIKEQNNTRPKKQTNKNIKHEKSKCSRRSGRKAEDDREKKTGNERRDGRHRNGEGESGRCVVIYGEGEFLWSLCVLYSRFRSFSVPSLKEEPG